MPVDVETLVAKRIPLRVNWQGEEINLHYRAYCEEMDDTLDPAAEESESRLRRDLARFIVDWDITDGDKPLPVTPRAMRRLPLPLLVTIWRAILTDMYPNPASAGTSGAG